MNQPEGTMEPHVGITLPKQRKPSFPSVQPVVRPPSMAAGPPGVGVTGRLPFVHFDLGSGQQPSHGDYAAGPLRSTTGFFEDEPPLLEELGINLTEIMQKTLAILNPIRPNRLVHEDGDFFGPLLIYVLFGLFQLLAGKFHFGVIFGWFVMASMFLHFVFNKLSGNANLYLDMYRCSSFVGYCLLPIAIFSAISLFLPYNGATTYIFAFLTVIWCTRACINLLMIAAPQAGEHRSLVAYACGLIYTAFSLLVLF